MFSYRHSFHAGNHGDVLKHLCQIAVIEKLKEKDKAFTYFDTHSGAGVYQLDSQEALKTKEYQHGVARLNGLQANNHLLNKYLALVEGYSAFNQYPGSPEIANKLLRPQDSMVLMEWNKQEFVKLDYNINRNNTSIHHRDGFEGLLALTPPKVKRGMVLIDPPYEQASEYQQVVDVLSKAYKRWSTGVYLIWYPIIKQRTTTSDSFDAAASKHEKSQIMIDSLSRQPFKNLLNIELCVTQDSEAEGMYGSGLLVINAPWQLDTKMESILTEITPQLDAEFKANFSINWLIKEN